MALPVLLVATDARGFVATRIPRALSRAGFEVTLLAPQGSVVEHSSYVARVGHLPDNATPMQWVFAFAASIKATSPHLVVPGDDGALRLLQTFVINPPAGLQPGLQQELATLIGASLGEPAHYRTVIDKLLLPPAAQALGVPTPPFAVIGELAEAEAFAGKHGYPVLLKSNQSSGRSGVAICADRDELARRLAERKRAAAQDFEGAGGGRMLVQAFVAGSMKSYASVASRGTLLSGYAATRLATHPEPVGPPSVERYHRSPELRAMATKLATGFGLSGFFSAEFVEDPRTGLPYLLNISRHVDSAHRGSAFNADHWAALRAALEGVRSPTRADLDEGEEHVIAHFPQEWLRDPKSRWLREYPVDVPWDEPDLIEAMLAAGDAP
jgi:predicted ATP-grasp superfamily ATP-dependent carboligase